MMGPIHPMGKPYYSNYYTYPYSHYFYLVRPMGPPGYGRPPPMQGGPGGYTQSGGPPPQHGGYRGGPGGGYGGGGYDQGQGRGDGRGYGRDYHH